MNMQAVQGQLEAAWVGPFNLIQWALVLFFCLVVWMFFGKDITARVQVWLSKLREALVPADRTNYARVADHKEVPTVIVSGWRSDAYGPEALYESMIASGIEVSAATEFVKANWEKIMAAKKKREAV